MNKQEYLPLANFLRHQEYQHENGTVDKKALESIQAQLKYTQTLANNTLTETELARRAKIMAHLKARFGATFTDGRPGYSKRLAQPGTVAAFRTFRTTALNEAGKVDLSASTSGVAA